MGLAYNIATEGIRAGHKYLSVLGLKWITIDIIPSPQPSESKGGGGVIWGEVQTYDIVITVKWNGKTYTKTYFHLPIEWVVKIIVKWKLISISAIFKDIKESVYRFKSSINSTKSKDPIIETELKDISISVKRKKK